MSDPMDRAAEWDGNRAVDVLIGRGGAAVWFCRNESAPRAAVRHGADKLDAIIDIAALRIGAARLFEAVSMHHGIPPDEMEKAVEHARAELTKRMENVVRIRPSTQEPKE